MSSYIKYRFLIGVVFLAAFQANAQVIYTEPAFPTADDDITVYYNAAEGNGIFAGSVGDVYATTGVITDSSNSTTDWKYVVRNRISDSEPQMTALGNDLYSLQFNIREFYNIPMAENVLKLAFTFNDEDGKLAGKNSEGNTFYVPVFEPKIPLTTKMLHPSKDFILPGEKIQLVGNASETADLSIYENGILVSRDKGTNLNYTLFVTSGEHVIEFVANNGTASDTSAFSFNLAHTATNMQFNITPNPSHGDIAIFYQTKSEQEIELFITDVSGKQIYTEVITSFPGVHSKSLEMDLEAGIYLVHLNIEDTVNTQKLIIQK